LSSGRRSLERVITDLAARFVVLDATHVDAAITAGLREIAEALELDRCTWWRVQPDTGELNVTFTWTRDEYRGMRSGDSAGAHVPWLLGQLQKGLTVAFSDPDEVPSAADREGFLRFGTKSGAAVPYLSDGHLHAVFGFSATRRQYQWSSEILERLRLVTAIFGQALMRTECAKHLQHALAEVRHLRNELAIESVQPDQAASRIGVPRFVVAESAAAKRVLEQIHYVAPTGATVLLLGETGTGKEVFAQAIHRASDRHARPMVTVNCAAIPPTLIESELFGRERGAFTGALARQIGRFEMAHGSTILLDEIGELPLEAQVKLLRVLQERVVERLGGGQPVKVDVRVIAATNRDLETAVNSHTFREDLFYRLNVFPITIPPLRERLEDVPGLVWAFIEEFSTQFHKRIDAISRESLRALMQHRWPGNVRELRNVIERAMIVAKSPRLIVELPNVAAVPQPSTLSLDEMQAEQIRRVLDSVGWRVRGPAGAAELLGIKPNTLDSRMAKLGIRREQRRR
jgi:transcriptional regulator with GAF, ATPase, and Fis domain